MDESQSKGSKVDWRRRREGIARAALPLYLERPWQNVRLEEICRQAGVSCRQVHYSFDGKEDIYRAAVTILIDTLADRIAAPLPGDLTVNRAIQHHVRRAATIVDSEAYRDLLFICLRDSHSDPWIATGYERRIAEPLRSGLENAVTKAGARSGMNLVILHGVRERYLASLEAALALPKLLPHPVCVATALEPTIAETAKLVVSATCTFDGFGADAASQSASVAA